MTSDQRIDAQAAAWVVRLSQSELALAEKAELDSWLASDSRHRGALLRAQAQWHDLDRLAALKGVGSAPPSAESQDRVSAESQRPSIAVRLEPKKKKKISQPAWRPRFSRRSFAALGGLLAASICGLYLYSIAGEHYETSLGVLDSVKLADGSEVTLNTNTSIHVRLKDDERRIRLDKGEALFEVAKDAKRPFIVHAGPLIVRAVGTIFAVRAADQRIDVTVTQGIVELSDAADGRLIRRLGANEQAAIVETREVRVTRLGEGTAQRQLAWSDGVAEFTGETLAEAAAEMNRHNPRKIIIDDPALATRTVVGTFRLTDPDNFAATVAVALGAQTVHAEDGIHLK